MKSKYLSVFAALATVLISSLGLAAKPTDGLFSQFPRTHYCKVSSRHGVIYPFQAYEAQELTLLASVNAKKIHRLLPSRKFEAVSVPAVPGRATVMLQAINYQKSSIEPYQEFIISLYVREKGSTNPPVPYLKKLYLNKTLPVQAGKIWGFDKEIGETEFQLLGQEKTINVLQENGDLVFTGGATFVSGNEKPALTKGEEIFLSSKKIKGRIAYSQTLLQQPFTPGRDYFILGKYNEYTDELRDADFKPLAWVYSPTSQMVVMNAVEVPKECRPLD